MHETASERTWLQSLLDDSYEKAGRHLLSIHTPEWRMTALELCETLRGVCVLNLATLKFNGGPVVAPVDGLFLNARFWFSSSHDSMRFRNIRNDPRVSAAYTVGEEISVTLHGIAYEVNINQDKYDFLRDYCLEVYGPTYTDWGNWGEAPFACIEPSVMYAIRINQGSQS